MDHRRVQAKRVMFGLVLTRGYDWNFMVPRSVLTADAERHANWPQSPTLAGRLAGYDDVNDADRLSLDPVMRQVVGGRALDAKAASASQMGRFETEGLATSDNRTALADLSGKWIDRVHEGKPPKWITLGMDGSVNPPHVAQQNTAWNGHFGCMCYHPRFVFNQFGHPPPDSADFHARQGGTLRPTPRQCAQCTVQIDGKRS